MAGDPIKISKDVYPVSMRQGVGIAPSTRNSATRQFVVEGLANNADALKNAINAVITEIASEKDGLEYYHPLLPNLPLASIEAYRSKDKNDPLWPDGARLMLNYHRVLSQVDLKRTAKNQIRRYPSNYSLPWYRDSATYDSYGRPSGNVLLSATKNLSEAQPYAKNYNFGVVLLEMPTVLTVRPSISYSEYFYKINSNPNAQFLEVGAYPAKTLQFLPYRETPLGDGQYLVVWRMLYNPRRWQAMTQPVWDSENKEWTTTIVDLKETKTFPTLPVHR